MTSSSADLLAFGQAHRGWVMHALERVQSICKCNIDDAPGHLHSLLDTWTEVVAAVTYAGEGKVRLPAVAPRVRALVRAAKRPTVGDVAEALNDALPIEDYRLWRDGAGWHATDMTSNNINCGRGKTPLHALLELALEYERDEDVAAALEALDAEPDADGVDASRLPKLGDEEEAAE